MIFPDQAEQPAAFVGLHELAAVGEGPGMLRASLVAVVFLALPTSAQSSPPTPVPTSLEEAAKQFNPNPTTTTPPTPAPPPTTPPATTTTPAMATTTPSLADEPREVDGWMLLTARSDRRAPDGSPTGDSCGYEREVIVERTLTEKDGMRTPQTTTATLIMPCATGANGLPTPGTPRLKLPPPYGRPAMAMKGVDVEVGVVGGLKDDDIAKVVIAHQAEIEACHTSGKGGPLVVRVVVNGNVASEVAAQSGRLMDSPTAACVVHALKGWSWPVPTDGRPAVASLGLTFADQGAAPVVVAAATPVAPVCGPNEKPKAAASLAKSELACVPPKKTPTARPCAADELPKKAEDLVDGELACKVVGSDRGVPFLKGELTHLGDVRLINNRTSFGVGLGLDVIDNVYFAVVRPDLNLRFGDFGLGLGAPLRFEVADLTNVDLLAGDPVGDVFGNLGRFRTEDWDQIEDFLRPLRYLSYGKKEDNVYIDLNRVHSTTIGHGQLVRRYSPTLDIDEDNLFANVDGYGDYGGVELMAGPFPLPRLLGGLVFIKPMSILSALAPITTEGSYGDMVGDSWSIGASYVVDLNTPTGLDGRFNPADQRLQLAVDPANQFVWRNKGNFVGDAVQGMSLDTEVKLLKSQNVDIKVYADYSHLFFPGDTSAAEEFTSFDGGGATLGGLLRVSLGETPVRPIDEESEDVKAGRKPREKKAAHAFRVRLEGRAFQPTFLPSYWNTMYEVDRFQFGVSDRRATLDTKIGYLASKKEAPNRAGYYIEASYSWVDALAVSAAFEDAYPIGDGADENLQAKNLALHIESQGLGWLQLFATYHFRNFDAGQFDQIFSLSTDNEILYAGARLQVLPIMFINVAAQRSFRLGFSDDDSPGVVEAKGLRFTSVGLENVWANGFDVELGWQF